MGRLNPQLTHFSHPHPLELTDNIAPTRQSVCCGCQIGILPGRPYYSCNTCGFCLHATCFKLPMKISHPGDPNHVLVLAMSSNFNCKACGKDGCGLCFSCKQCNLDYHSLCTLKPLVITSHMHKHPLCLEFKPPYGGQGFRCDLCKNPGLNQWFYSCVECGFDVHLDCPTTKEPDVPRFESTTRSVLNVVQGNQAGFHPNGSLPGASGFDVHLDCPTAKAPDEPRFESTTRSVLNVGPGNQAGFHPNGSLPVASGFHSGSYGPGSYEPRVETTTCSVLNVGPGNQAGFHPNGYLPGASGFHSGSYGPGSYGPNQTVLLTPNGVPMTTVLQPNRGIGYSDRAMGVGPGGSQGGMMSGMGGLVVGSIVTGIGQQLGQELVSGLTHGSSDGSGSSHDSSNGVSDIMNCWVGGDFL